VDQRYLPTHNRRPARQPASDTRELAALRSVASCGRCLPSWEINYVPIDRPPWSVVNREGGDRFKCPGCRKAVAWRIRGLVWRPTYSRDNISAPTRGPWFAGPSFASCFCLCRWLPLRHDGLTHGRSDLAPFL